MKFKDFVDFGTQLLWLKLFFIQLLRDLVLTIILLELDLLVQSQFVDLSRTYCRNPCLIFKSLVCFMAFAVMEKLPSLGRASSKEFDAFWTTISQSLPGPARSARECFTETQLAANGAINKQLLNESKTAYKERLLLQEQILASGIELVRAWP